MIFRTRDPHSTAGTGQKKKRHKTENGAVLHAFPYPDSEGGPATLSNSSKSDKTKRAKSKRASTSKRKHKTEPKKRTKKEVKSDQPEDVPEQCNGTNEKPSKVDEKPASPASNENEECEESASTEASQGSDMIDNLKADTAE